MLVIDDDEDARLLIGNIASGSGWDWDLLCDGYAGWAVLANMSQMYDLIFIDLRLPGHTGEELISMADKVISGQKVIVITGTIGELAELREKTLAMWKCVKSIIYKPFGPDDILPHMAGIGDGPQSTPE